MENMVNHSFWKDRSVLVTGATGLLGSYLTDTLIKRETAVVCLIRDWVPQSNLIKEGLSNRAVVVRGDITDQALLERIMGEYEIETVFHLAAQTIVPIANRNPISTFESNIKGTWSLLEAARRSPTIKQVIVASSDKAYGTHKSLPYTEDMPLKGDYPYDVSKSCADLIAQSYAKSYSLPVNISRCGNFYGGGDLNWNRIIPGTIRSLIRGKPPIIRSDGRFIRDYIYAEDGAHAYSYLAECMENNPGLIGEAFNFSNESPVNVLDLVKLIIKLMGSSQEPMIQNIASREITDQHLSSEKARKILGWRPKYDLETGLLKTIEWYKSFFINNISQ